MKNILIIKNKTKARTILFETKKIRYYLLKEFVAKLKLVIFVAFIFCLFCKHIESVRVKVM